jgi:hypothetical protein
VNKNKNKYEQITITIEQTDRHLTITVSSHHNIPHFGSVNGSPPMEPGAKLAPLKRFPPPLPTTCAVTPLILAGRADRTLAVSEYMSLVTLVTLRIVPARLTFGLPTAPREFDTGEREVAVKAVSLPDRAASTAPVGDVQSDAMGDIGSGSMKGSAAKES